jgi:hypothetical protein
MQFAQRVLEQGSRVIWGLLLIAAVSGCNEYNIRTGYGPAVKFTGLGSSFDWVPNVKDVTGDPRADNPNLHALIRQIVENELAAKGFVKKAAGAADFWMEYRIARRERGLAYPGLEYAEGSLIIYVIDPSTRQWIWRASAGARLGQSDTPEKGKDRLERIIKMMLKDFPAKGEQASPAKGSARK